MAEARITAIDGVRALAVLIRLVLNARFGNGRRAEDGRFQAAAARWHARFVLEADLPLREAAGVMTLLCRLRGADRHVVRRRFYCPSSEPG